MYEIENDIWMFHHKKLYTIIMIDHHKVWMIIKLYKEVRNHRVDFTFRVHLLLNMLLSLFKFSLFCGWKILRGKEDVFLLWGSIFLT